MGKVIDIFRDKYLYCRFCVNYVLPIVGYGLLDGKLGTFYTCPDCNKCIKKL